MALVPFALDRQLVVDKSDKHSDKISKLVKLERGALTTEVQHLRETRMTIKNRLQTPAKLYVRHSVLKGWKLVDAPKNIERLGDAHLFPMILNAGESRELVIMESTPMTRTLDLRSQPSLDIVRAYLSDGAANQEFAGKMRDLLKLNHSMANHRQAIESIRERMTDYRVRMDELHGQIVTLKAVRSGGALMKHLKRKMADISERVQRDTIKVVEHQEKLMLARIEFQDAISDLSLESSAVASTIRTTR